MMIRTNKSHTQEELEEKYNQVRRLHLSGERVMAIVKASGLSYPTVRKVVNACKATNNEVPSLKARGRKKGDGRHLDSAQQAALLKTLCTEHPDSARLAWGSALWDSTTVRQLVQVDFAQDLERSTIDNYLERWGIIPEHPFEEGLGKNQSQYTYWAYNPYPQIEAESVLEQGEILWISEDGIYGEANKLAGFSDKPSELVMISVIHGDLHIMNQAKIPLILEKNISWVDLARPQTSFFYRGWLIFLNTAPENRMRIFLDALNRRSKQSGKKIFLIASKKMRNLLEASAALTPMNDTCMKISYLPT